MAISIKNREKAFKILKEYNGDNPYILLVKKNVFCDGEVMNDFSVEYVLSNYNYVAKEINKQIKIADWYSEKLKEKWGLDFSPKFLSVKWILGETNTIWHCYIKYRRNMEPIKLFLPKRAVLTNFLVEDYHKVVVDFERYDKLSTSKDPNRKLKEHQKEAVQFLLSRKKCVLADSMGLGKTTSLSVAAIEGNFDSVLIICPASVKSTWKKELMWYVPERDISIIESINGKNKSELETYLGYGVGKSGKKVAELKEEAKERGKWRDNRFVIVNFDILDEFYKIPKGRSQANIDDAFLSSPMLQYITDKKSLIIIDEAHRLSNSTSIRYKVILDLVNRGEPHSIYAATGTPITNNPKNFYCVLKFLNDPITYDYRYYMERYCDCKYIPLKGEWQKWTSIYLNMRHLNSTRDLNANGWRDMNDYVNKHMKKIMVSSGASNLDELKDRVSHIYLRRVKEDLPGMVNKTIHEVYYDLNMKQLMEYNRLWDEYEKAQLELDPTKEVNKELLEGAIYRKYLSNEMVPNTIELVNDLLETGEKVIIACCYDEELYTLRDYFKDKCVIYNGKMNPKEKDKAKDSFMENPDIKVFIGNIQAAGVGLTLTAAKNLVFNNISFVPGDNLQMQDRIHRINQTEDVDIYYQIFRDTQYEKMWDIVLRKSIVIDQVIKTEKEK